MHPFRTFERVKRRVWLWVRIGWFFRHHNYPLFSMHDHVAFVEVGPVNVINTL